jgi:hypothetical protein
MTLKRTKNNSYVVFAGYNDDADAEDVEFERLYTCAGGGMEELLDSIPAAVFRKQIKKEENNIVDITDRINEEDDTDEEP